MRIIYVTTAMAENDYKSFVSLWNRKPNPSNQNFHNKLIRSLALTNEVDVVSVRPFSRKFMCIKSLPKEEKKKDNIYWHYLPMKGNKISRIINAKRNGVKVFKKNEVKDAIILTDTINPSCLTVALKMAKSYKIPLVGIATDSPSNITGTYRSYTLYLLKRAAKCNGFIALTEGLNTLYNEHNMPHVVIEGVIEDRSNITPHVEDKPYFYFGGSLLQRYGVYDLIEGFKRLNRDDIKLVIAGHSGNNESILSSISSNDNIEFVGTLDIKDVLAYEKGAIANINPRPFSEDLDRFSVPSKTLEYLTSGNPTISVRNTILKSYFENEIVWVEESNPEQLSNAMNEVLNASIEERMEFGRKSKEKVLELFSMDSINKKLSLFLETILNK